MIDVYQRERERFEASLNAIDCECNQVICAAWCPARVVATDAITISEVSSCASSSTPVRASAGMGNTSVNVRTGLRELRDAPVRVQPPYGCAIEFTMPDDRFDHGGE